MTGRPTGLGNPIHRTVRPGSQRALRQARASIRREVQRVHGRLKGDLVRAQLLTPAEASALSVEVDIEVNDASGLEEELERRERDRRPCQPCG